MSTVRTALLIAALALALPAMSATADTPKSGEPKQWRPAELYDALAAAQSELEARAIEARIVALWVHTESPSAALIFEQSAQLMAHGDFERARDKLDLLTEIAPDYAEAWNFRALVHSKLGQFDHAVADLRRVLELEPKHFRALELLGTIFEELDNPKSALKAFKAAVEINPHMEGGAEAVRRLTEEVKGKGI